MPRQVRATLVHEYVVFVLKIIAVPLPAGDAKCLNVTQRGTTCQHLRRTTPCKSQKKMRFVNGAEGKQVVRCDVCLAEGRELNWQRIRAVQEPMSQQFAQGFMGYSGHDSLLAQQASVSQCTASQVNNYAGRMQTEQGLGLRQHCDFCEVPRPAYTPAPPRPQLTTGVSLNPPNDH